MPYEKPKLDFASKVTIAVMIAIVIWFGWWCSRNLSK
jgi:hypothetical protein